MDNYEQFVINLASGMKDSTSANDILIAYSYGRLLEQGVYISGNPDLENHRANERYHNIIKRVVEANPIEYLEKDFDYMDSDIVFEYTLDILKKIFGDSKEIIDAYKDFIKSIEISGDKSPMNGYVYRMVNTANNTSIFQTVIPTIKSQSSVTCLIHEFMHYYFQKNDIEYKKAYYEEILSILFEKIASEYVEEDFKDKDFIRKIENIRLSSIHYHNSTKKDEMKLFKKAVLSVNNSDKDNYIKFLEDYEKHHARMSESYGIGYIYAESLYNLYKSDLSAFQKKMREIFSRETSLQDTLDYFDINMCNKKVFEQAKNKIRLVTK